MKIEQFPYEAVIFDMDGVLIDSEPKWKIAMEEVFHSVGCSLTRKDFQQTVGLRIDEVIDYWYARVGWEGAGPREVEMKIVQRMVELIGETGEPLPGVVETVRYLKERGKKIGLATSSYAILVETTLKTLGLTEYFDVTHSAEHETWGKPHPSVYMTAARELGLDCRQCLVIEDSFNGIVAAKAARMDVVCIPEKTHEPDRRLVAADFLYEDMLLFLQSIQAH